MHHTFNHASLLLLNIQFRALKIFLSSDFTDLKPPVWPHSHSLPKREILCRTRAASLQNRLEVWRRARGNQVTHRGSHSNTEAEEREHAALA